jgi:hypothetical protein
MGEMQAGHLGLVEENLKNRMRHLMGEKWIELPVLEIRLSENVIDPRRMQDSPPVRVTERWIEIHAIE